MYRNAIDAVVAAGPAIAGLLAERSFFWMLIGDVATSNAFGASLLIGLPTGRPHQDAIPGGSGILDALRTDAGLRRVLVAMFGAVPSSCFRSPQCCPLHVTALGLSTAPLAARLVISAPEFSTDSRGKQASGR